MAGLKQSVVKCYALGHIDPCPQWWQIVSTWYPVSVSSMVVIERINTMVKGDGIFRGSGSGDGGQFLGVSPDRGVGF